MFQKLIQRGLCGLIRSYQLIVSPFLSTSCCFTPSCSEYMKEAIEQKGVITGMWMGGCRLLRCHPWQKQCLDPVR